MKPPRIEDSPEKKEWDQGGLLSAGAEAESARERNRRLQEQGVIIPDITAVWVDPTVVIAAGCILYPNTYILGRSQIGPSCEIGPDCRIENTRIGEDSQITRSQLAGSRIEARCQIGPNCQLKNAEIGSGCYLTQSQVENSRIAANCRIEAFSYIGADTQIKAGSRVIQSRLAGSQIAENCQIGPFCQLRESTAIGRGSRVTQSEAENSRVAADCEIGPFSHLRGAEVGRGSRVAQSRIEDGQVAEDCNIGPFSYIRPDSVIGSRVRIGDFVEIKNSVIGDDTMISHLTYVGDADVGRHVNFGCGTVLVNYDGIKKHRSVIGDHAFIGCNTNLVSPVRIGEGAFTAAGSTITEDLPANSLGIARARQQIKEDWVTNRKGNYKGGNNK